MELTDKQIKDLVARRHPEYIKKKEHWDFLASTYAGGRAWFDDNIFRYFKEGDQGVQGASGTRLPLQSHQGSGEPD